MNRFTKVSEAGILLPDDAVEWVAVQDEQLKIWISVKEIKVNNQADAMAKAAAVKLCGFTDWRPWTVDEAFAVADRTKHNPAIDTKYFPDCKSDLYWTSTPTAFSPAVCAWVVSFSGGVADWNGQGFGGFVRAVRASQ
jgi:Protein of unknown function (DUF1566)